MTPGKCSPGLNRSESNISTAPSSAIRSTSGNPKASSSIRAPRIFSTASSRFCWRLVTMPCLWAKKLATHRRKTWSSSPLSWARCFSLLQGYAVYEAENLPVEGFMPFIKSLMPALEAALSGLTTTIRAKDYDNTQATLDVWAACPRELRKWCGDHRVDHSLVDPQISLMDEAIKDGKGHADFAYLYELLKKARTGQSARVSAS